VITSLLFLLINFFPFNCRSEQIALLLIEHGADPLTINLQSLTPHGYAIDSGGRNPRVLAILGDYEKEKEGRVESLETHLMSFTSLPPLLPTPLSVQALRISSSSTGFTSNMVSLNNSFHI